MRRAVGATKKETEKMTRHPPLLTYLGQELDHGFERARAARMAARGGRLEHARGGGDDIGHRGERRERVPLP